LERALELLRRLRAGDPLPPLVVLPEQVVDRGVVPLGRLHGLI
jgi:hypothetical protein